MTTLPGSSFTHRQCQHSLASATAPLRRGPDATTRQDRCWGGGTEVPRGPLVATLHFEPPCPSVESRFLGSKNPKSQLTVQAAGFHLSEEP